MRLSPLVRRVRREESRGQDESPKAVYHDGQPAVRLPFRSGAFTVSDLIQHIFALPVPFNMVVVIVALVMASGIITSIGTQVRKYVCLRHELEFKRELVDRGMSADEIEQIVKARSPNRPDESM